MLETISDDMLRRMFPAAEDRLTPHLPFIVPAMDKWQINTPERVSAFLAQLAHESGEYRWMEEIWGPTAAQQGYEFRVDLGNTQAGDGYLYRGRAGIGITGRANYQKLTNDSGVDFVGDPDKAMQPQYATEASGWFWWTHNLNVIAQMNWFKTCTKIINGGYNGLAERIRYNDANRAILGLDPVDYGAEYAAIKQYQLSRNLIPDGDVGPRTINALLRDSE